jgi:hypothetical protein
MSNKFISLIESICTRPAMYSVESVLDIRLFSFAYICACPANERIEIGSLLSDFEGFVKIKFDSANSSDWAKEIFYRSSSNLQSIHLFQSLFLDFITSKYPQSDSIGPEQ